MSTPAIAACKGLSETDPRAGAENAVAALGPSLAIGFSGRAASAAVSRPVDPLRTIGLGLVLSLHAAAALFLSLPLQPTEKSWPSESAADSPLSEQGLLVSFIERASPSPSLAEAPPIPPSAPSLSSELPPRPSRQPKAQPQAQATQAADAAARPEPAASAVPAPVIEQIPARALIAATDPQASPTTPLSTQASIDAPMHASPRPPTSAPTTSPTTAIAEARSVRRASRALRSRAKRDQQDYLRELMAQLLRHRSYPDTAKKDKTQGTVLVRFAIDREGRVLSAEIDRSSGSAELDQAALDVLRRASPLPALPTSMGRDRLSISLPIEYTLHTG